MFCQVKYQRIGQVFSVPQLVYFQIFRNIFLFKRSNYFIYDNMDKIHMIRRHNE